MENTRHLLGVFYFAPMENEQFILDTSNEAEWDAKQKQKAQLGFLILASLFLTSLITCNLIFQKFFAWTPLAFLQPDADSWMSFTFELSVGIIPYPVTFLITDIISEFYGKKKANQVVVAGFVASAFVLGIIYVADATQATVWSPVQNEQFNQVFGLTGIAVASSLIAYLTAQVIDIRIYHFWKKVTKGKYLWVRNNFSTITSQLVDTSVVLLLLCWLGEIEWTKFWMLLFNGWLFKVFAALVDTPVLYAVAFWVRSTFGLQPGEELKI